MPTLVNSGKKIKPLLPSKGTHQHIQLPEEGRLISDNREMAKIFTKRFIDGAAAHIPTLSEHAFAKHLIVNKISQKCNHLQFSFRHVEVGYVKKLIDTLNPRRSLVQIKYHKGLSHFVLFVYSSLQREKGKNQTRLL